MHTRQIASYFFSGIFWMLVLPRQINSQDPRCTSYSDLPRNCTNIRQCPSLLDVLIRFNNFAGDYLRSTVCGCDGDDPLVCCPDQLPPREVPINGADPSPLSGTETPWQPQFPQDCGYRRTRRSIDEDSQIDALKNNSEPILSVDSRPMHWAETVTLMEFRIRWLWMTMLGYKTWSSNIEWNCGGSLISSRHVLTAAHCIDGQPNLYLVRLGEYDLNDNIEGSGGHIDVLIERATVHPLFNMAKKTNDLGVLKLQRDVDISGHIRPICLPIHHGVRTMDLKGQFVYSAGWGQLNSVGHLPAKLQEIYVPVLPLEQCHKVFSKLPNYADNIDGRTICAGEPGGQMPCAGDSGGPLILMQGGVFHVVGVDSYGVSKCAQPDYPELFVKVSEYLDFILSQLN